MTSIVNIFSNFTDSTNITEQAAEYKANQSLSRDSFSPGLTQGEKYKRYQQKIKEKLENEIDKVNSKEGFENGGNGLTAQSNKIINKNNYS